MKISQNEIDSIQEAGTLDSSPVKLIKTKGGFWIAVGKPRGKVREEAISAGSHPAIVKFDLERRFPGFQPPMMKSEHASDKSIVEKHSHFLNDDLRKSGHDIYSIQEGPEVNFHITKHNIKVASVNAIFKDSFLTIENLNIPKEFSKSVASATVEKAVSCNAGLRFKNKQCVSK